MSPALNIVPQYQETVVSSWKLLRDMLIRDPAVTLVADFYRKVWIAMRRPAVQRQTELF